MLKVSKWCQTRNLFVQRGCNLTITTKPFDQDNSKFYSKFFIKLPTTFMLYDFSNERLKMVEKFSLGRLLNVDRFTEGWYKFENSMVGSFKNSQIFTVARYFMWLHFILQAQLNLRRSSYLKNSRNPTFPEFKDCLDDP